MAEMDQLSSMPLSKIAIDDSDPPVVHYGSHMPVAASTPTGTILHSHSSPQKDSYQEIITGIPQGSLYPTLSSLSSGLVASDTNSQAFLDIYHMLSLLDKCLYDNPKQHTHCMSSDNEYVALLKYAIHFNIDISMFPTV